MGLFGKYVVRVFCVNGEVGYYMGQSGGYIRLAYNTGAAQHYRTKEIAVRTMEEININLPTDGEHVSRVSKIDIITL